VSTALSLILAIRPLMTRRYRSATSFLVFYPMAIYNPLTSLLDFVFKSSKKMPKELTPVHVRGNPAYAVVVEFLSRFPLV